MSNQAPDYGMLALYKILRQELVGEYGTELAIIDNHAYQVIRVRNLRGASDEYPRFKVVIRESAAGIVVRYRQAGYHAGDPKRQTIRREDPDGAGRIVEIVRAAIQAERKRLIEFRQQEG